MWDAIKSATKRFFLFSETIAWGRIQYAIGTLLLVLTQTDLTPIFAHLDPIWKTVWTVLSAYMIATGFITNWARKRGDPALGKGV